jgi:hypothetical protein
MKHYKNIQNNIFGFKEGESIPDGLIEITIDEVNTLNTEKQKIIFDSLPYNQKRAAEYPPMANYLDALVKGDQAQIDAYIAACLAVKAKYPKDQTA